jgi:aldehyde:ferredoxin oxidoreductase
MCIRDSYSTDELARVGDRIWYIKRAIGNLCGATRDDDRLPTRMLEPHPEGITSSLHSAVYPQFMSLGPMQKLRFERIKDVTASIMTKYLYPNMDKLLTSMNRMPGFSGHRKKLEQGDPEEVKKTTVAFEQMIEEFYKLRDMDEQGRPSRKVLEELGMKDVADALHG